MDKIQIGEVYMEAITQGIYSNKTMKYLLPCLKDYGDEFRKKFSSVLKVAVGIGDIIISNRGIKHERHIFVLVDTNIAKKFFISFLDWIREQDMYEDDYLYGNIQVARLHMAIIKIPEHFYNTFEHFKIGGYSKMYTKDEIERLFKEKALERRVFIKDHNYKIRFVNQLNEKYGSTLKTREWEGEVDFPPDEDEIFNNHIKKKT